MKATCSLPGCSRPSHAKQYCNMHYQRLWKHGSADDKTLSRRPTGELRVWLKNAVSFKGDDCLDWPSAKHHNGYGNVTIGGRSYLPHRIVCAEAHGPAPSCKHEVAHSCGNRACCNPRHLRWATKTENAADRFVHGTQAFGERHHNAKLSDADVTYIRSHKSETLSNLAQRFGVSFQTISDVRRGKHRKRDATHINYRRREAI